MIRSCTSLRFRNLPLPPSGVINQGYGDFVFAQIGTNGQLRSIPLSEYRKIHPLTKGWIERPSLEEIKGQARKILGQNVHPIFVPNTLYGLYFIEQCIQERVGLIEKFKETIENLNDVTQKVQWCAPEKEAELVELQKKGGFWPLCYYSNQDYLDDKISHVEDARASHLVEVAGTLNETIVTKLVENHPEVSLDGLSYEQIQDATRKILDFHKDMNSPKHPYFHQVFRSIQIEYDLGYRSFLSHFFPLSGYEFAVDMGRDPRLRKIVEDSICLECSPEVKDSIILYRGSRHAKESLIDPNGNPLSLSLGSRLLAGCIHDAGAMALSYAGYDLRKMIAFIVPKAMIQQKLSPFFVPEASSLEQFCSGGEGFHARTVVPHHIVDIEVFGSVFMKNKAHVGTSRSIQEIDGTFQNLLDQAVCL